ncbi:MULTISPECIES: non-ribosomal peptide synthetase [unclassified Streptomyces]|uniref:non-ribosomal peptide synthetase n=1 Tax=unclassified Streptomyces TaxID=2593676 RepID=UPI00093B269E|nr:non-ribosomal peptide synthetase [Streptomyces sp. CB02058]
MTHTSAGTLSELIEEQARRTPLADAVVCGSHRVGYGELDHLAGLLAARLRAWGVGPDVPVGIHLERSVDLTVAVLAVLKAGGVCLPLDPGYPADRLSFVLEDAEPPVVLTHERLRHALPAGHVAQVLCLDAEDAENGQAPALPVSVPVGPVHPDNLAWITYTSGSTGRPKGVGLSHGPLATLARSIGQRLDLEAGDRVLQFAAIGFSVAAEEIFSTWLAGACLVLDPEDNLADSAHLTAVLDKHEVTVVQLTPSYWYEWLRELTRDAALRPPPSLRLLVVGSEPVAPHRVADWLASGVRLVQEYGASEATVSQLLYETDADEARLRSLTRLPIGTPLEGARPYVLDPDTLPVPDGEAGELYLGGSGVARGYLARPGLTAERFLPDPYAPAPGGRMYRTGDLVRRLPGGELEFLGRADFQLKIRGVRIEPEEVETAIASFPGVVKGAVFAKEGAAGVLQLVACVVWQGPPDVGGLRAHLSTRLTADRIPSRYVSVPALPLNPNGKVDRRALRNTPVDDREDTAPGEAPRTPVEAALCGLWDAVLATGRTGVHDNFFEHGGDSLLATRLTSWIREALATDLPRRAIFEAPTVAALATRVEAARAADTGSGALVVPPVDTAPLTAAQRQMWFLHKLNGGDARYNEPVVLRLDGELDEPGLRTALGRIVQRHAALRTVFVAEGGVPQQVVRAPDPFDLPLTDLNGATETQALRAVTEQVRLPFDLTKGPVFRAALVRTSPRTHYLVLIVHHIVFDGRSMAILLDELAAGYGAGGTADLAPLDFSYPQHAVREARWWETPEAAAELAHWTDRLADAPATTRLPTAAPARTRRSGRGATVRFTVPPEQAARLAALARTEQATPFMAALTGFYALIARSTGAGDLLVGTLTHGRDRSGTDDLVGLFINSLCLRTRLPSGVTYREALVRVRATALDAFAHQDVPLERVVEALRLPRSAEHTPLFQLLFSYGATPARPPVLPGLAVSLLPVSTGTSKFDAVLQLDDTDDGGLTGQLEYDLDLFDPEAAESVVSDYRSILDAMAADPDRVITDRQD